MVLGSDLNEEEIHKADSLCCTAEASKHTPPPSKKKERNK